MNFTNALLVCLVATQLPVGWARIAWATIGAYMLLHCAVRVMWSRLEDYQMHRSTFGRKRDRF